jgi:poly-beta-1,6-N-acetyl-D-glucosamine synthase
MSIPILIFCAFVIVTVIQVVIWLVVYRRVAEHTDTVAQEPIAWPDVSVIVCARNAQIDLEVLVPQLFQQKYAGKWELIVVDDASSDTTSDYLRTIKHEHFVPVFLQNKTIQGKKEALDLGIRAAQYAHILVTDADCRPASDQWIQHMMLPMTQGRSLVLGFAPFVQRKGWLMAWQRWEACFTAILYLGWALAGRPYMGVGRNMAYKKALYTNGNGFADHLDLPSGDDDLFVNAIAQKGAVGCCMHPDSHMYSEAKSDWKSYYKQKTRHFSTSPRYRSTHQWMLSVAGLSHSLHYFFMLLLFLAQSGMVFVLLIGIIRIVIIIQICRPVLRRFHEQKLLTWLPILDPLIAVYYTVFIPGIFLNTFSRPRSWT